eukprot:TRINITY_DN28893_c0_g1_i3.p1 TRINITY_DN28893_c0_g1~~TRINITY_DN28893_c0_g1_i3.p1  ORF type:complete len:1232 (+),score=156.41 TRINITY_DN28893_c0_g1_i3:265-3696(+)
MTATTLTMTSSTVTTTSWLGGAAIFEADNVDSVASNLLRSDMTSQGLLCDAWDTSLNESYSAILDCGALVLPLMKESDRVTSADAAALEALVRDEGVTLVSAGSKNNALLLDKIFGWSLDAASTSYSSQGEAEKSSLCDRLCDGPTNLIFSSAPSHFINSGVPTSGFGVYPFESSFDSVTAVFSVPVGAGYVHYLAYDWTLGGQPGWSEVLRLAIRNLATTTTLTTTTTRTSSSTTSTSSSSTSSSTTTDLACLPPSGWCSSDENDSDADFVYRRIDCDFDTIPDPYCLDKRMRTSGFIGSSSYLKGASCAENWADDGCLLMKGQPLIGTGSYSLSDANTAWRQLELSTSTAIGLVSVLNVASSCASRLFSSQGCDWEYSTSTYTSFTSQGAYLFVRDKECVPGMCFGYSDLEKCEVSGSRDTHLTSPQTDGGDHWYDFDCKSMEGKYILLLLPGIPSSPRTLDIEEFLVYEATTTTTTTTTMTTTATSISSTATTTNTTNTHTTTTTTVTTTSTTNTTMTITTTFLSSVTQTASSTISTVTISATFTTATTTRTTTISETTLTVTTHTVTATTVTVTTITVTTITVTTVTATTMVSCNEIETLQCKDGYLFTASNSIVLSSEECCKPLCQTWVTCSAGQLYKSKFGVSQEACCSTCDELFDGDSCPDGFARRAVPKTGGRVADVDTCCVESQCKETNSKRDLNLKVTLGPDLFNMSEEQPLMCVRAKDDSVRFDLVERCSEFCGASNIPLVIGWSNWGYSMSDMEQVCLGTGSVQDFMSYDPKAYEECDKAVNALNDLQEAASIVISAVENVGLAQLNMKAQLANQIAKVTDEVNSVEFKKVQADWGRDEVPQKYYEWLKTNLQDILSLDPSSSTTIKPLNDAITRLKQNSQSLSTTLGESTGALKSLTGKCSKPMLGIGQQKEYLLDMCHQQGNACIDDDTSAHVGCCCAVVPATGVMKIPGHQGIDWPWRRRLNSVEEQGLEVKDLCAEAQIQAEEDETAWTDKLNQIAEGKKLLEQRNNDLEQKYPEYYSRCQDAERQLSSSAEVNTSRDQPDKKRMQDSHPDRSLATSCLEQKNEEYGWSTQIFDRSNNQDVCSDVPATDTSKELADTCNEFCGDDHSPCWLAVSNWAKTLNGRTSFA